MPLKEKFYNFVRTKKPRNKMNGRFQIPADVGHRTSNLISRPVKFLGASSRVELSHCLYILILLLFKNFLQFYLNKQSYSIKYPSDE